MFAAGRPEHQCEHNQKRFPGVVSVGCRPGDVGDHQVLEARFAGLKLQTQLGLEQRGDCIQMDAAAPARLIDLRGHVEPNFLAGVAQPGGVDDRGVENVGGGVERAVEVGDQIRHLSEMEREQGRLPRSRRRRNGGGPREAGTALADLEIQNAGFFARVRLCAAVLIAAIEY